MIDEMTLTDAIAAALSAGAAYAEARGETSRQSIVAASDGAVEDLRTVAGEGWGIRVAVMTPAGGGWGFAATSQWGADSAAACARQAVEIAQASATARRSPLLLDDLPAQIGAYSTPFVRDPFAVPMEEQLDLIIDATNRMRAADPRVVSARGSIHAWRTEKRFLNSRGADLHQVIVETSGGLNAVAQDDAGYAYRRSAGNMHQAGWEYIEGMQLREEAERVGREAGILVAAPWVSEGPQTVALGDHIISLIIHESCGHPTELDRVLGWEAAFAGTSFLMPDMLGDFRYGSPQVSIVADSTTPGGLGTFGWDDEGTPAQRWDLVRDGTFVGYLSNRESAAGIRRRSNGCGRASGWDRMPIVRMVNVSLEPRQGTLDDLIADIDDGLYVETPSSWSLDDKRLNFHFSTELCREIKHGKLGDYRKGAAFQERTPVFWGACRAVGGPDAWRLHGFPTCAKGEPLQLAHVAHGASPIVVAGLNITRG